MSLYRDEDRKQSGKIRQLEKASEELENAVLVVGVDVQAYIEPQTQADSTAVDVAGIVADFNLLLAKLRTAGILTA